MPTPDEQLARVKTMPRIVRWLTIEMGCWVVGSRASFRDVRITETSDWDILVPFQVWQQVVPMLPLQGVTITKCGGFRFHVDDKGVDVDVWPQDLAEYLMHPFIHVAWYPKTGSAIERV